METDEGGKREEIRKEEREREREKERERTKWRETGGRELRKVVYEKRRERKQISLENR